MAQNSDKKDQGKYRKMISRLTIHGFLDYYESRGPLVKNIWLAILCLASISLIVQVYFSILG